MRSKMCKKTVSFPSRTDKLIRLSPTTKKEILKYLTEPKQLLAKQSF